MFFHPLNLFVVAFAAIVFIAWAVLAKSDAKSNPLNYAALTLVTGVLIRSFANEGWVQLSLGVVAIAAWVWYLTTQHSWPTPTSAFRQMAVIVVLAGVVFGIALRSMNLWLSLIVAVVVAMVALTNQVSKLQPAK